MDKALQVISLRLLNLLNLTLNLFPQLLNLSTTPLGVAEGEGVEEEQ
jgi:hypothetical protein